MEQEENDLISELLQHSQYSLGLLSQIWTGGKARNNGRRAAFYYWDGSDTQIDCKSKNLINMLHNSNKKMKQL